jgi:hypothetical protein
MGLMDKIKSDWDERRREIDEAALRNHPFKDGVCKWFVHKDRPVEDKELFFGPLTGEEVFTEIDDTTNIFHILAMVGAFPSANMARKNWNNVAKKIGMDVDVMTVPEGFTTFVVGKKKFDVVILK